MVIKEQEIRKVLENWDIGKIKSIKLSKKGKVNNNWLIKTSSGKFFLRRFAMNRTLKDITFEVNYLKELKELNFNYEIPNPIKTKSKKFTIKYKGKYFWLDNLIPGKTKKGLKNEELRKLAKMLSIYHNILEKLNLKSHSKNNQGINKKEIIKEAEKFINKLNKKRILKKEERTYLENWSILVNILNNIKTKEYEKLKKYAIHRDLNPENILWEKDKISGILDFENVPFYNDPLIKDISIIIQTACSNNHKIDLKKTKLFIKEYKRYRRLKKEEIKLIPEIITASYIDDFEYQYWLYVNDKKRAKLRNLIGYSNAAQWHFQNKNKIIKDLI